MAILCAKIKRFLGQEGCRQKICWGRSIQTPFFLHYPPVHSLLRVFRLEPPLPKKAAKFDTKAFEKFFPNPRPLYHAIIFEFQRFRKHGCDHGCHQKRHVWLSNFAKVSRPHPSKWFHEVKNKCKPELKFYCSFKNSKQHSQSIEGSEENQANIRTSTFHWLFYSFLPEYVKVNRIVKALLVQLFFSYEMTYHIWLTYFVYQITVDKEKPK